MLEKKIGGDCNVIMRSFYREQSLFSKLCLPWTGINGFWFIRKKATKNDLWILRSALGSLFSQEKDRSKCLKILGTSN